MTFKEFYAIIDRNKYYVFSINDIMSFYPNETAENIKKLIYRWNKKGWIYSLKNGLYELTYPKDFSIPDLYIANKLYSPSYISLETALSNYSIIPEVSMGVTSITSKPTRRFNNKHGLFIYRSIQPVAFKGYFIQKIRGFEVFMAEPEKAIIDYLYFKTLHGKKIDFKEERIDFNTVQLRKNKIEKYAKLFNLNIEELYAYL
ncbi:MAG: hypothetical protein A2474_06655 [Elusimicrobia bacterium RIFOXYC2_FULL_34_12]|nr:MAG: hypothetical protein A2474_06655 [Elusimicrobia bacterium RIFOXYC2_FULL_34_12]